MPAQRLAQPGEIGGGQAGDQLVHEKTLDRAADFVHLAQECRIDLPHAGATIRPDGDIALAAELLQRIAHRHRADAVTLGQIGDFQAAAGREHAGDDILTDRIAQHVAPKRTVLYCLLGWGFFSMATGFAPGFKTLVALRFLLGMAEGPLWTALVSLLSLWFLQRERGRAIGLWNLSLPFGALLSGPISGVVLSHTDWHVMFLLEGLPAWIWAIVWWRSIPATRLRRDGCQKSSELGLRKGWRPSAPRSPRLTRRRTGAGMLAQPAVWLLLGATCFNNMTFYGIGLWLPSAIKAASALDIGSVGWLSALPYLTAIVGVLLITQSSDRRKERRLHAAVPMIVGGILLAVARISAPLQAWRRCCYSR